MVLEGGVAGAQPLHKGGRLRPTAHKMNGRERPFRWLQLVSRVYCGWVVTLQQVCVGNDLHLNARVRDSYISAAPTRSQRSSGIQSVKRPLPRTSKREARTSNVRPSHG